MLAKVKPPPLLAGQKKTLLWRAVTTQLQVFPCLPLDES